MTATEWELLGDVQGDNAKYGIFLGDINGRLWVRCVSRATGFEWERSARTYLDIDQISKPTGVAKAIGAFLRGKGLSVDPVTGRAVRS